jgi:hypothetical protein
MVAEKETRLDTPLAAALFFSPFRQGLSGLA